MIISRLLSQSETTAALKQNVSPGEVVSLKVVKALAEGYQISVKGVRLVVSSTFALEAGQVFKARVGFHEGSIVFKALPPDARVVEFLQDAGLPDNRTSRLLLQAFRQFSLPLHPDLLARAYNRLKHSRRQDTLSASLIAAFQDKGMDPPSHIIDYLYGLGRYGKRDQQGDGRRRESREDEGGEKKDLEEVVAAGEKPDPLQLFNHRQGSKDHWIIIPFGADSHGEELGGSIRLRLDKETGKPAAFQLFCSSPEREWRFTLADLSGGGTLRIHTDRLPKKGVASAPMEKLTQKLHNLGVKVDDIIRVEGFRVGLAEEGDEPRKGVDTYV